MKRPGASAATRCPPPPGCEPSACPAPWRRRHRRGCRGLACALLLALLSPVIVILGRSVLRRLIDVLRPPAPTGVGDLPSAGGTRPATGAKQTVPGTIYRKPDPMIYDQYYLQSQGFAVTWDNPDIHLERPPGTRVSSHDLLPNTAYQVVSRIWNLSETAPAPGLPVRVSYLRFGIGGGKTDFAETQVDLPVKGSPALPARAVVEWTTPPTSGHYCLQVELLWPAAEDANPDNNLGQHNTDVKALTSPATFTVPVRNQDLQSSRHLRLLVDAYAIPPRRACSDREEAEVHRSEARSRHHPTLFPVPEGWEVQITPSELALEPGQEREVTVQVTAPPGFVGRRPFNINAYAEGQLLGGVTLYVEGS